MKTTKIKSFFKITALFSVLAFIMGTSVNAAGKSEKMMWYYKPTEDGSQPICMDGDRDIAESNALYLGKEGEKKIYLTFDAGYGNENVEKILDTLKKHNAKAAFFVLPGIIRNDKELVMRMADEGHTVCNHSYSHGDMSKITDIAKFREELEGCEKVYRDITGKELAKYFRPPEGAFSKKTLKFCEELGYTPVFWSFAYKDWDKNAQPDVKKSLNYALKHTHDGMVVLMHPMSKTNALMLDELMTEWENKGYAFGTLDELAASNKI